ncbi:hypothetical protein [Arthrobacter sp. CG_A4]|uniref:hypothetical protein n=1 Tax=Arthrobacter sp. CG_A4 TaxID=3071706 RepID=UPI002E008BBE|nr:hypothetical protein [Arthrobacter sp. CG_A4]
MTPATNRPQIPTAPAVHSLQAVRPPAPMVNRGSAAQHTVQGRRDPHPATLVAAGFVGSPYCERCGTDEFVYLETFVPATHHSDGSVNKLGEVTYFCSGCDDFAAHAVPASWVPPGWYFG